MSLATTIRSRLTIPAICAPMYRVSGPALVREACAAGVVGALPRHNVKTREQFSAWLGEIRARLDELRERRPEARMGPLAVNLSGRLAADELAAELALCREHEVEIIISAMGDPTEITARAHDQGAVVFHDVTTVRFAEKAIRAGVDGLICIGAGGGGNSGTMSYLALVPRVRAMFDGLIVMAGGVATGAAIRAAEVLGADLAYLGTRFIATAEAEAPQEYKELLLNEGGADLTYSRAITGVPCNWLTRSLRRNDLDPAALPELSGRIYGRDHLPPAVRPWVNLWSAGQGIELIEDAPSVAELVTRLHGEYVAATAVPHLETASQGS